MVVTEVMICAITGYFNFSMFNSGYYSSVTGLIVMRIIAYLETLILYNIKSLRKNYIVTLPQWIATLFIPLSTLAIKIFFIDSENSTKLEIIISTVIIFMINLLTFYLYNSLASSYSKEKKNALIGKEKEMYYNQCLMMQETNDNLKKFRHEINNQFISMKELLNNGMYDELSKYMDELTDHLTINKFYSNTGNVVIDSIINYKLNLVVNSEIETEIAVPSVLDIDINDIVVIIGNILDNAINALNDDVENGKLYFKVVYSQGRLIIKETNNYKTKICYENGEIQSSKSEKSMHGYGLRNIEEAVKRYDGYMDINHTDSIFSIDIIMFI